MAVDIYLLDSPDLAATPLCEPRLSLEDAGLDGLIVCVQEFTGRSSATGGPEFDQYGSNAFTAQDLPCLSDALARAAAHFRACSEQIPVWVGTEIKPVHRELYEDVPREKLVALITKLRELVQEAIDTGQVLLVLGD
jgi:hypothetical protein